MALETSIAQYLVPCVPGTTFRETMRLVLAPQHYAIDLAGPIDENPAYSDWILRTDFLQSRIKQWMSDSPEGQVHNRAILEKNRPIIKNRLIISAAYDKSFKDSITQQIDMKSLKNGRRSDLGRECGIPATAYGCRIIEVNFTDSIIRSSQ